MSSGEKGKIFKYTHKGLPFSKGRFIGDDKFLAVGYDKAPFLFKKSADKWSLDKVLDKGFDKFKDFSAKVGSKDFFALREVESDIKIDDKFKMKERDTKHENILKSVD